MQDRHAEGWSHKTLHDRRWFFSRFTWWLEHEEQTLLDLAVLSRALICRFLTYVRAPHPTGRFGCTDLTSRREARPSAVSDYYRYLRTFVNWCIQDGLLQHSRC